MMHNIQEFGCLVLVAVGSLLKCNNPGGQGQ